MLAGVVLAVEESVDLVLSDFVLSDLLLSDEEELLELLPPPRLSVL